MPRRPIRTFEDLLQDYADRLRRLEERDPSRYGDWILRELDDGTLVAENDNGGQVTVARLDSDATDPTAPAE